MAKKKVKRKKPGRYRDDPRAIFRDVQFVRTSEETELTSTYTGLTTILLYVLRIKEHWRIADINRLCEALEAGLAIRDEIDCDGISKRLKEVAGFTVSWEAHNSTCNVYNPRKDPYKWYMEERLLLSTDYKNEYACQYFCIVYDYLMSIGFGKKRINRINEAVVDLQKIWLVDDDTEKFAMLKRELELHDVFVEMPEQAS